MYEQIVNRWATVNRGATHSTARGARKVQLPVWSELRCRRRQRTHRCMLDCTTEREHGEHAVSKLMGTEMSQTINEGRCRVEKHRRLWPCTRRRVRSCTREPVCRP